MRELSVDPWLLIDASLSFTEPRLDALVTYRQGKRVDGRVPGRRDISPFDLRPLVGKPLTIDVADGTGKSIGEAFAPEYAPTVPTISAVT